MSNVPSSARALEISPIGETARKLVLLAQSDVDAALRRLVQAVPHVSSDEQQAAESLLHAAVDLGILSAFVAEATVHITTKSRPWPGTGYDRAADDPHVILRFGKFFASLHALEELFDEAIDKIESNNPDAARFAAITRAYATSVGQSFISSTIELLGASATSQKFGFDVFWRNFTTHARDYPPHYSPARANALLLQIDLSEEFP